MLVFDDKKTYAICHNPNGMLALPVGWLYIETKEPKHYFNVANTDMVDGTLLNHIIKQYGENVSKIVFKSPQNETIIYEKN